MYLMFVCCFCKQVLMFLLLQVYNTLFFQKRMLVVQKRLSWPDCANLYRLMFVFNKQRKDNIWLSSDIKTDRYLSKVQAYIMNTLVF